MRLIQRGKRLFTIRPAGTTWYFRAIAAAGVLIASVAQTESRAGITVSDREGFAQARGTLSAGPPSNLVIIKMYTVEVDVPPGVDSFTTITAEPPPDKTTIPGASATSLGQVNATITLDTGAATLVVTSAGSVSASVSASGNTAAFASATGSSSVFFNIDQQYDYAITSVLSAGGEGVIIDPRSFIGLSHASSGPIFQRRRFRDFGEDEGSAAGILEPGDYFIDGFASAAVSHFAGISANANFQFTLQLTPVGGDVIRWVNPTGGTFGETLNWSPQQVPEKSATRDDTALFDLPNNYPVNIDSARTIERLVVRAGRVDFNNSILTAAALSPTVPSVSIENDGRLNIATGGLRSVHAIIGNAPPLDPANPPTAEVLVANINQGWQLTGNLAVGGAGKGRLFVANGGLVGSASATIGGPFGGEAVVGGHDSRWASGNLAVGSGGNGTLNVEAGAEVESGSAVVGFTPGTVGEVTVTGIDATDGSPSRWTTDFLTVGGSGATGGLNILDGGVVSTAGLVVADAPGSTGRVIVSGSNAGSTFVESRLVAEGITVGGNGDLAQMFVTNGGAVSSNLFMNIEQDGSLEIAGPTSQVDVTGDVNVGTNISGSITFNGGRMIVGGLFTIGAGGSVQGNGTLIAPNRDVQIGGHIDPGLSPGILTFDANYVQTGTGVLTIEVAGTAPGQFDVLEITGDATLGGTLLLEFIDGFAPRQGDVFQFLDVGGALSGAFASVEVRNLAPGFQFDLRPDAGGMTMVALNDGVFVPEPATLAVLFAGMLATLFRRQFFDPVA